jgi:hypothetical protein
MEEGAVYAVPEGELPGVSGELELTEDEIYNKMYRLAFSEENVELYDGPHAYTVEQLMERWGYRSRDPVERRAKKCEKDGTWKLVKVRNPVAGRRPLKAWVLTELYQGDRDVD